MHPHILRQRRGAVVDATEPVRLDGRPREFHRREFHKDAKTGEFHVI